MSTPPRWVAALERLPPDHRGYRRVLRLHAIERQPDGVGSTAVCGYEYSIGELRAERDWKTVTVSGRCALCAQRLRLAGPPPVVDLVARDRPVDLNRREEQDRREEQAAGRRLRAVPDPSERPAAD